MQIVHASGLNPASFTLERLHCSVCASATRCLAPPSMQGQEWVLLPIDLPVGVLNCERLMDWKAQAALRWAVEQRAGWQPHSRLV